MSSGRRTTRPVRQLSLQHPTPRRQHVRRQRSTEDDCGKSLQVYANPVTRNRLIANSAEKPKVRIAWSDNHCGCDNLAQVEMVARQIPSRFRSTTGRSGSTHIIAEQASILYSRQEIAERLRQAWKHREQNKANIDIFLAHGMTVEERCDSELSMSTPPIPRPRRDQDSIRYKEKDLQNTEISNNLIDRGKEISEINKEDMKEHGKKLEIVFQVMENDSLTKEDENSTKNAEKKKAEYKKMTDLHINTNIEKKTCINIDCTSLHLPTTNQSYSSFPSLSSENVNLAKTNDDFSLARQKRASFHSGSNRAFLVPMMDKSSKGSIEMKIVPANKSAEIKCASADKTIRSSIDRSTILFAKNSSVSLEKIKRTSSAPPQRRNIASAATRMQVNIMIDAPSLVNTTDKLIVSGKMQDEQSAVEKNKEAPTKISRSERLIKSASLKRRSRSTRRRFFTSSSPNECKEEDSRGGERGKSSLDPRTSDVITMVSLVSSADSDSDIENSPGDDKLIDELRSKLPTTSIIKTSINPNAGITRKPIKSVSFQKDSFDEKPAPKEEKPRIVNSVQPRVSLAVNIAHRSGNSEDLIEQNLVIDSVVATPTTLVAVPTLLILQNTEKAIQPEIPLTDREKRCLAVPISDLHDKKRKLLRMRSTSNRPLWNNFQKKRCRRKKHCEKRRYHRSRIFKQPKKKNVGIFTNECAIKECACLLILF